MSEYEQIVDEIVKHGVVINVNKIVDDNYIPCERKYVGCVVELDFSEHDKVFEDKIVELQIKNNHLVDEKNKLREIINKKLGGWDDYGVSFEEIFGMREENKELKQRIDELEDKIGDRDEINRCLREQIAELESEETEKQKKRTGVIVAKEIDGQIYVTLDDFMSFVNDFQA